MSSDQEPTPAEREAAEPTVAGSQSPPAVTSVEAATAPTAYSATMPPILSPEQRALLVAVLDRIVPPREGLAGAGGLGVDAAIERTLALTPHLRRLFLEGLAEIEVTVARQSDRAFGSLDAVVQEQVLRAVEAAQPVFFAALVEHTYRGYYILPEVHALIGYESRPPQPLGYALAPFHEGLLALQRNREPFWRRTPS